METEREVQRQIDAGHVRTIDRQQAKVQFPKGSINKLGIIIKPTPEGMSKDRIIVDARESGINEKQDVPEISVLPRGTDVCRDARCLHQGHARFRRTFDADEKPDPGGYVLWL